MLIKTNVGDDYIMMFDVDAYSCESKSENDSKLYVCSFGNNDESGFCVQSEDTIAQYIATKPFVGQNFIAVADYGDDDPFCIRTCYCVEAGTFETIEDAKEKMHVLLFNC